MVSGIGGEEGIRTLDTLMGYTRFPIVRARPTTRLLHVAQERGCSIVSLHIIMQGEPKVKDYFSGIFAKREKKT